MLVFITDLVIGGRQTFCLTLVNELARTGHNVGLYVSYGGGENLRRVDGRVKVKVAGKGVRKSLWEIYKFVKTNSGQHCLSLCTEITYALCLLKRLGLISNPIFHRESVDVEGANAFDRFCIRCCYPVLSGMIVTSRHTARGYLKYYKVLHPVAVVRSPCRFAENRISHELRDETLVVAVGRLDSVKGFDRLIDAFRMFPTPYKLEIWGEGEQRSVLQNKIDELGLVGRVKLCGHTDDVAAVYSRGSILVVASYSEGLPNVLLEALACGCRAVVPSGLYGSVELLQDLHLDGCFVEGDFSRNLLRVVETVKRQPDKMWNAGFSKLKEMTGVRTVVRTIAEFVGE